MNLDFYFLTFLDELILGEWQGQLLELEPQSISISATKVRYSGGIKNKTN